MVRQTLVPCSVTRSTILQGAQHIPELALRSTEFHSPENLIFPALKIPPPKVNFPSPPPPLNNNFQVITQQKQFLAVVIAPVPFLF